MPRLSHVATWVTFVVVCVMDKIVVRVKRDSIQLSSRAQDVVEVIPQLYTSAMDGCVADFVIVECVHAMS